MQVQFDWSKMICFGLFLFSCLIISGNQVQGRALRKSLQDAGEKKVQLADAATRDKRAFWDDTESSYETDDEYDYESDEDSSDDYSDEYSSEDYSAEYDYSASDETSEKFQKTNDLGDFRAALQEDLESDEWEDWDK